MYNDLGKSWILLIFLLIYLFIIFESNVKVRFTLQGLVFERFERLFWYYVQVGNGQKRRRSHDRTKSSFVNLQWNRLFKFK